MRSGFDSPTTQKMLTSITFLSPTISRLWRHVTQIECPHRVHTLVVSDASCNLYTVRWSCGLMSNLIEMCGMLNDIRASWECSSCEQRDQVQNPQMRTFESACHAAMPSINNRLLVHIIISGLVLCQFPCVDDLSHRVSVWSWLTCTYSNVSFKRQHQLVFCCYEEIYRKMNRGSTKYFPEGIVCEHTRPVTYSRGGVSQLWTLTHKVKRFRKKYTLSLGDTAHAILIADDVPSHVNILHC